MSLLLSIVRQSQPHILFFCDLSRPIPYKSSTPRSCPATPKPLCPEAVAQPPRSPSEFEVGRCENVPPDPAARDPFPWNMSPLARAYTSFTDRDRREFIHGARRISLPAQQNPQVTGHRLAP
jgi:hypothetical protein